MIKTNKSKKKRIGLILCSLFICLCSILCIVPFNKTQVEVKADEVSSDYVYRSSNLYIPFDIYSLSDAGNVNSSSLFYAFSDSSIEFTLSSSSQKLHIRSFIYQDFDSFLSVQHFDIDFISLSTNWYSYFYPISFNGVTKYFCFSYKLSSSLFNYNVVSIRFYSDSYDTGLAYNHIQFIDNNTHYLDVSFTCNYISLDSNRLLRDRVYYLSNNFQDNELYNQGFLAGESTGYRTGYSDGVNVGYNEGYSVGNDIGYNNGFSDGVEDSNQYTFMNLLSATIDAPVKYFQSLFNFELLGVNLQGFLTGLFTLCIIVAIVKLCLGG